MWTVFYVVRKLYHTATTFPGLGGKKKQHEITAGKGENAGN